MAMDDSTAVLSFRKRFNEFLSTSKKSTSSLVNTKLNFDLSMNSSDDQSLKSTEESSLHTKVDLISAKGFIAQLQMQLDSAETSRKRAKIEHDRDVGLIKNEHQRDLDKVEELRHQLVSVISKEESTRQELSQLKAKLETTTAELHKKISALQKEKIALEDTLLEIKQENRSQLSKLMHENGQLMLSLEMKKNELSEAKQLLHLANKDSSELKKLQLELADTHAQLSEYKQKTKELELGLSRADEDIKVGKALRAKLDKVNQLESENSRLSEEVQYMRAVQENTLVLKEEFASICKKLERAEERCVKLATLEVEFEEQRRRLTEWETMESCGISGLKSAAQLTRHIAELQRNNELMLEKNGQLKATLQSMEVMHESSKNQLQQLQSEMTAQQLNVEQMTAVIKRLNKKLLLMTKEKDGYKSIIDSYESELTSVGRPDAKTRQTLEEALNNAHRHITELETERDKLSDQLVQTKTRAVLLEQQVCMSRELNSSKMSQPPASAVTSVVDETIVIELRQKVAELEKKVETLSEEKENLLGLLERRDMQGDYDPRTTKVLHFANNPYSLAQRRQAAELERLQAENSRLVNRLKVLEEFGGRVDDLTAKVDEQMMQSSTSKEVEEMKAQLSVAELRNKRLMEAFKKTSQELREVSYQLLGYRIDIPSTGNYRLMNMYAESPNDFFIFKQTSNGELQMLANNYSASFGDHIEMYLKGADSIPAFLSSVTLDLFNRQTMIRQ